ncbi:MAG: hypothetical protein ACR2PY_07610 [Salinispira sp.]
MQNFLLCVCAIIILIGSCELFESSPFPNYLGGITREQAYAQRIIDIDSGIANSTNTRYQILPIIYNGEENVIFLVSPSPGAGRQILMMLNKSGELMWSLQIPEADGVNNSFNFQSSFGLPLASIDVVNTATPPNQYELLLAGSVTINRGADAPAGSESIGTNELVGTVDHGLLGGFSVVLDSTPSSSEDGVYIFGVSEAPDTQAEGESVGYFQLSLSAYQKEIVGTNIAGTWQLHSNSSNGIQIINIVDNPPEASEDNRGYELNGIIQTDGGALFLLRNLADNMLYLWELTNRIIISEDTSIQSENQRNSEPIDLSATDKSFRFSYTNENIIVYEPTGKLKRYDLNGTLLDEIRTEARSNILYTFSPSGDTMYRLDPETLKIQVMNTWW